MLTCFASTNERLVKNVAVAAALDTCEGTQQVSGATDAEVQTCYARRRFTKSVRSAFKVPQQVSRASKGRPWSPEGGLRTKNSIRRHHVRLFADKIDWILSASPRATFNLRHR